MVGFIAFQQKYVCEPKVVEALSQFLDSVVTSEYESQRYGQIFPDEQEFLMFKSAASKKYTLEFGSWVEATLAATFVKFESGPSYTISLGLNDTNLPICLGQRYTVRRVVR
jgi:hypothetical protein